MRDGDLGTGTWDACLGRGTRGLGRGDVGTWGRGDVGTWGRGDVGRGDAQTKTSEMKI